jgi:outer membrane protein OmpA-like peptidoglycan-associated protein
MNYFGISQNNPEKKLTLSIYRVDNQGEEVENTTVNIEEQIRKQQKPFLSYIFFAENSSDIPKKYIQLNKNQVKTFDINKLSNMRPIGIHYNTLNIIGSRLTKHENVILTVNGYNSNRNDEEDNFELSEKRAFNVKRYLVLAWGIKESRIKIQAFDLPKNPTRYKNDENDKFREEENRRVEFSTNGHDEDILGPVFCSDTIRLFEPYYLRLKMNFPDTNGVKTWRINAGKRVYSGDYKFNLNEPLALPESIDWNLSSNQLVLPLDNQTVYAQLTDMKDRTYISPEYNIKVKREKSNDFDYLPKNGFKEYEYQLIVFDYKKANITKKDEFLIKEMKKIIKDDAKVQIYGYSDTKIGSINENLKLSEERANSLSSALKLKKSKNYEVNGLGGTELHSNETPEGRFLNRTVIINIKTPLDK